VLAEAGARHIYVVGRSARAGELAAAGTATFIGAGCDVLAILNAAQEQIAAQGC
jgi:hypothetical protein